MENTSGFVNMPGNHRDVQTFATIVWCRLNDHMPRLDYHYPIAGCLSFTHSSEFRAVSRAQQFAAAAQDMFEQEINGEGEGNVETEQLGDKPDIQDIAFNE
eukprot:gene9903-11729_t